MESIKGIAQLQLEEMYLKSIADLDADIEARLESLHHQKVYMESEKVEFTKYIREHIQATFRNNWSA
jgi:hypothetical protein